jgi:hypothetical protein
MEVNEPEPAVGQPRGVSLGDREVRVTLFPYNLLQGWREETVDFRFEIAIRGEPNETVSLRRVDLASPEASVDLREPVEGAKTLDTVRDEGPWEGEWPAGFYSTESLVVLEPDSLTRGYVPVHLHLATENASRTIEIALDEDWRPASGPTWGALVATGTLWTALVAWRWRGWNRW